MGENKIVIEKFDGSDFNWWKMQIEALLCQKDLDAVIEEKPATMSKEAEAEWKTKDKKARGLITLLLTKSVAFNIMSETTAHGMMTALSNMYEKPSAANKVFLMRELFTTRMKETGSVTEHINSLNSILSRLSSVGMKFDDETKAVLLLSSLPDSWSGTVTAVTNSMGTEAMTFEKMRDLVLGEDIRRRNTSGSSSSELLHAGRGNSRGSGSSKGRGRSSSRARSNVRCWDCNEKGHVRTQCPKKAEKGKELNTVDASGDFDDDVLLLSELDSVDSWVMDSGASLHATHSSEGMRNVRFGDFGKVRLGTGEILDITGSGDLDLTTTLGATWTLENVKIVPRLKTKLISVSQLDNLGMTVRFGNGKWTVVKGNLVIARGFKKSSLYLVPVPSEDMTTPTETNTKIRLADSKNKRVKFVAKDSTVPGNPLERIQGSERVRDFRSSGSTKGVPTSSGNNRWVRKTEVLNGKFSPVELLVGSVPLYISGADCSSLWESVEIEDAKIGLRPAETSMGPGN